MKFVPHVSGGHGLFGRAPGFGEVKDALGRRVTRFGGNQRDKVEALTRAGERKRLRDRRPSSVPQDLGNCALDAPHTRSGVGPQ